MNNNKIVYEYRTVLNNKRIPVLKETASYESEPYQELSSAKKIVEFINKSFQMEDLGEEYVYMLAFDSKYHILGIFELSHGIVDASFLRSRELFMRLLLVGAVNFVVIHNHPSGNPTPSSDDISISKKISEAAQIMDITFTDNIIIGKYSYYSFKEQGLL